MIRQNCKPMSKLTEKKPTVKLGQSFTCWIKKNHNF